MKLNPLFCISGYGVLHEVLHRKDKTVARIRMFTHADAGTLYQDDVWVEAEVKDEQLQRQVMSLAWAVKSGCNVLMVFKAEYRAFLNAMSGQTPADPNSMVSMHVKLCRLEACFIDGQPIKALQPLFKKAT